MRRIRRSLSQLSAVIAAGVHLFPFRTEKLSPPAPMVLGGQPPGRVGRRRISFERGRESGPFSCRQNGRVAIERAQPAHAFRHGRMRGEEAGQPLLLERIDRCTPVPRRGSPRTARDRSPGRAARAPTRAHGVSSAAMRPARSASNSRFGDRSRWTNAEATGPRTNRSQRVNQPPIRLVSTITAAVTTATDWTKTSLCRMCASSCASTPSSSAGGSACSSPRLTATAELRGPRPAEQARGRPSRMTYRRGLETPACAASRSTVEWSPAASPSGQLLRADEAEDGAIGVPPQSRCDQEAREHERSGRGRTRSAASRSRPAVRRSRRTAPRP